MEYDVVLQLTVELTTASPYLGPEMEKVTSSASAAGVKNSQLV